MKYLLNLNDIRKEYGKKESLVNALNGVSLQVGEGDMISIMGASGSGKSTLLNIIGLLDSPTSGSYSIRAVSTKEMSAKAKAGARNRTFGFIVQDFALIEKYTVKQNVAIPFSYGSDKLPKRLKEERIFELLEKLGIQNKANIQAYNLSGGQRQRVAIARALVNNPDIILADEPTGALDSETSKDIMELLKMLNREGKTLIVITHDKNISEYCNTQLRISDGRFVQPHF
jgi:putative ABC transport system ATP-binding protein